MILDPRHSRRTLFDWTINMVTNSPDQMRSMDESSSGKMVCFVDSHL